MASIAVVLAGAAIAGFTTGFAGFGTALIAAGFWYHALPASMVPPLSVLAAVAAHVVGMLTLHKPFNWRRAGPFLAGGALGVPIGVAVLAVASPDLLRTSVGVLLVGYSLLQLTGVARWRVGARGGRAADSAVGVGGGFLGGFAGLSGPLPLIWLQLRGGPPAEQRATYQPFNLVMLSLAAVGMAVSGQIDGNVLVVASLCLPATVAGAWIGTRVYHGVGDQVFRRVVLALLTASGAALVAESLLA